VNNLDLAFYLRGLTPHKQQHPLPTSPFIRVDDCLVVHTFTDQVHQLAALHGFLRKLGIKFVGVLTDAAINTGLVKLSDEAAGLCIREFLLFFN
jgi:hypothetical protein